MAYFADLVPCDSGSVITDDCRILAIGWLDSKHPYARGTVEIEFFRKLIRLIAHPLPTSATNLGFHVCELCRFTGGGDSVFEGAKISSRSKRTIYVPGNQALYCAPELIAHYVDSHEYKPPEEFVSAVLSCPDPTTMEFRRRILANGGGVLLKSSAV